MLFSASDIPQATLLYRVTLTMARPVDEDGLPHGGLEPPGGSGAVELAAVLVSAQDVVTAWLAKQTIVSMIVHAGSRQAAEAQGRQVARALDAGPGACDAACRHF